MLRLHPLGCDNNWDFDQSKQDQPEYRGSSAQAKSLAFTGTPGVKLFANMHRYNIRNGERNRTEQE